MLSLNERTREALTFLSLHLLRSRNHPRSPMLVFLIACSSWIEGMDWIAGLEALLSSALSHSLGRPSSLLIHPSPLVPIPPLGRKSFALDFGHMRDGRVKRLVGLERDVVSAEREGGAGEVSFPLLSRFFLPSFRLSLRSSFFASSCFSLVSGCLVWWRLKGGRTLLHRPSSLRFFHDLTR